MEEYSEEVCAFKKSALLTMDLMVDSYKWKKLAEHSDNPIMHDKYMSIANALLEMFKSEYAHLEEHYREV